MQQYVQERNLKMLWFMHEFVDMSRRISEYYYIRAFVIIVLPGNNVINTTKLPYTFHIITYV